MASDLTITSACLVCCVGDTGGTKASSRSFSLQGEVGCSWGMRSNQERI